MDLLRLMNDELPILAPLLSHLSPAPPSGLLRAYLQYCISYAEAPPSTDLLLQRAGNSQQASKRHTWDANGVNEAALEGEDAVTGIDW